MRGPFLPTDRGTATAIRSAFRQVECKNIWARTMVLRAASGWNASGDNLKADSWVELVSKRNGWREALSEFFARFLYEEPGTERVPIGIVRI